MKYRDLHVLKVNDELADFRIGDECDVDTGQTTTGKCKEFARTLAIATPGMIFQSLLLSTLLLLLWFVRLLTYCNDSCLGT